MHISIYLKLLVKRGVFASLLIFLAHAIQAQNIYGLEPIQVVGSMNGYGTGSNATTSFRRVSVTQGNPTDGRSQWVKTYNVQSAGGDFVPTNMLGGSGSGFLFISGPVSNRFQNKWVFTGVGQGKVDTVNACTAYNSGFDMGLNLSLAGRYTFVFNDCGYTTTNAKYYVGYTSANPVQLLNTSQQIQADRSVKVLVQTSAKPSSTEHVFVRYSLANNFASTGSSTIVEASSISSPSDTLFLASVPSMPAGTSVTYYVFTSTLSLTQLNSSSEFTRSLCALQVLDNSGINYTYSLAPKKQIGFRVDMKGQQCTAYDSISISGNAAALGNWASGITLTEIGTSKVFGININVDSAASLEYKFRYHKNGQVFWESNMLNTSGNRNLPVTSDTILGEVCFGKETACGAILAPTPVTFRVDLSLGTPNASGKIYVMGNFTSPTWQAGAIRLNPVAANPGMFEVTQNVCVDTVLYKFINGDSSVNTYAESFPSAAQRLCTLANGAGGFNRFLVRTNANPVLLDCLFDSCLTLPDLSISSLSPSSICGSASVNIAYQLKKVYAQGTLFTAQLSDANGQFTTPQVLNSFTLPAVSGYTNISVPAQAIAGTYKLRLVVGTTLSNELSLSCSPFISMQSINGSSLVKPGSTEVYTTNNQSGVQYVWIVQGGTIQSGQGSNSVLVNWASSGAALVQVKANSTCTDSISKTIEICTVFSPGNITGPKTVRALDTSDYSVAPISSLSYTWKVSGGTILSGQNTSSCRVFWLPGTTGQLIVKPNTACFDTSYADIVIDGVNGVKERTLNTLLVYPNPVKDKLFLDRELEGASVSILDISGRQLFFREYGRTKLRNEVLDMSNFVQGTYFLRLEIKGEVAHYKLIKEE
ncbi:MAG: hypothetical protein CFE21_04800 [Bacteroidetes bacterium B1(2017)]|nr:MAG: hypothetical protein CFE21_04800 [Bacteroidetes bacterium B1(2017)]